MQDTVRTKKETQEGSGNGQGAAMEGETGAWVITQEPHSAHRGKLKNRGKSERKSLPQRTKSGSSSLGNLRGQVQEVKMPPNS